MQDFNLDEASLQKLEAFVDLFQEYNQHTNLSAIRERENIWQKHVVDSLMPMKFEKLNGNILDIGTGGGLPGIPLAIAYPASEIMLLDSVGKKVKACDHFIAELELQNAHTLHGRAEKLAQEKTYTKSYDVVVSRATAYLPTILAWAEHFLKPGGKIILYKSPSAEELADGEAAAGQIGLQLAREHSYELGDQERKLLVYTRQNL